VVSRSKGLAVLGVTSLALASSAAYATAAHRTSSSLLTGSTANASCPAHTRPTTHAHLHGGSWCQPVPTSAPPTTANGAPGPTTAAPTTTAPTTTAPTTTAPTTTAPTTTAPTTTAPTTTAPTTTAPTTTAPTTTTAPGPSGGRAAPRPGQTWQWELSTSPSSADLTLNVPWWDIDGFDNTGATVAAIHAKGAHAICYISAGTYENWRPDASSFPASVLGASNGWPGEKWLDIRQLSTLEPIMNARLAMCAAKGFDAVEPDNVDGYSNSTGFALTAADQLTYNSWLASAAHAHGMSVALKNDGDQIAQLQPSFDFAIYEQCYQYGECNLLAPFVAVGKAALDVEYNVPASTFCPNVTAAGIVGMQKDLNLTAYRVPCP